MSELDNVKVLHEDICKTLIEFNVEDKMKTSCRLIDVIVEHIQVEAKENTDILHGEIGKVLKRAGCRNQDARIKIMENYLDFLKKE